MSEEQEAQQRELALIAEQVLVNGNLQLLTPQQRHFWYINVCESLGLNYKTRPFEYITVQGKMIMYARRDATDQLRKIHSVSVEIISRERMEDVYVVTARAKTPDGRTDESVGAVSLIGLRGEALANAFMKAETKAKRRVTLSIVGLGWMDETEAETIPSATGHGYGVPRLPPARKSFDELTEDEKRERVIAGFNKRWREAEEKGLVEKYHLVVFALKEEETVEYGIEVGKALGEVLKSPSEETAGYYNELVSPSVEGAREETIEK